VRLDDVRGFVLDVDGTLVHRAGEDVRVQPGAREVLERVRASGRPLAIFTNGSHLPPEGFAEGLREVGLPIADDELLTPLRSVQTYVRQHLPGGSVLLFGQPAVHEWLERAGMRIVDGDQPQSVDAVFVAHADTVDFPRLERAARAVLAGARLLTASYAPAYAGANGPILSRGAMTAAAIAKASSTRPIVVGKPSRAALRTASERLGAPPRELAVIGDDVTMDVALGRLGGARTILVASGMSGRVDLERVPKSQRPDAVVDGVAELLDWL
jgi:HAD superfamily hydrolase (TIGR01450 family)